MAGDAERAGDGDVAHLGSGLRERPPPRPAARAQLRAAGGGGGRSEGVRAGRQPGAGGSVLAGRPGRAATPRRGARGRPAGCVPVRPADVPPDADPAAPEAVESGRDASALGGPRLRPAEHRRIRRLGGLLGTPNSPYSSGRPIHFDPGIAPLLPVNPHPDYPSAHATQAGEAEAVLAHLFPATHGVSRPGPRNSPASRLSAGIHFRSACDAGLALGRAVAGIALERGGGGEAVAADAAPARRSR